MKGCGHGLALADDHRIVALGGQNFHTFANALDLWRPDENHFDGGIAKQALSDGAVDLASVGVAANADVDCAQAQLSRIFDFLGEENCAGTGSERGL